MSPSARLATRTVTHAIFPASTTTGYIHDIGDHIIAETDQNGVTQREYIWLGDLPVAVVDQVAMAPVIYYVHTDHLFRPVVMTDAYQLPVWSAAYEPFGEVAAIATLGPAMDLRFPGQWFQLETGLHYNWHRHYDPATGRYLQPDPLIVDDGAASVGGLSTVLTEATSVVSKGALIADAAGRIPSNAFLPKSVARAMLPDGPSLLGYARQSPLMRTDASGLMIGGFSSAPNTSASACGASQKDILKIFAGTLIDKRYDEVLNITHCTYSTPFGTYTIEHNGYIPCPDTTPAPR